MKFLFVILLTLPLSGFSAKISGNWPAEVLRVIDGDTFLARIDLGEQTFSTVSVRIKGVDTPEKNGYCAEEISMAQEAKVYLTEIFDKADNKIILNYAQDGKYKNRVLGEVKVNGKDLSTILLQKPFVRKYSGKKRLSWCD
ncbi:MAG: thermonuclease family protein [Alphaproteobacteria bacterium]|nr:thermonuclease family protein [Alphaproteobacteria bacterium]